MLSELGGEVWFISSPVYDMPYVVFNTTKECWDNCNKVQMIASMSDADDVIGVMPVSVLKNKKGVRRATEEELLAY